MVQSCSELVSKWSKTTQNGPKSVKMAQNGSTWAQNGSKWVEMGQNGSK
jgi:hypothetical protein